MPDYNKLEKHEAAWDGGVLIRNSGRGQFGAGDYRFPEFGITVDCKFAAKSFTLNKSVWAKVSGDALKNKDEPSLKIILGQEKQVRLWVIPDSMMQDYLRLRQLENDNTSD